MIVLDVTSLLAVALILGVTISFGYDGVQSVTAQLRRRVERARTRKFLAEVRAQHDDFSRHERPAVAGRLPDRLVGLKIVSRPAAKALTQSDWNSPNLIDFREFIHAKGRTDAKRRNR